MNLLTMRRPRNLSLMIMLSLLIVSVYCLITSLMDAYDPWYIDDYTSGPNYDNWPPLIHKYYPGPIQRTPYTPTIPVRWRFNTSAFLQRADVIRGSPKIITWVVKSRRWPKLPEPVRMRVCPDMPCRVTTEVSYQKASAALVWTAQIMRDEAPPPRSHPDQVFIFHNDESQKEDWIGLPSFRKPAWRSAFNWTMTYRSDSDIAIPYAVLEKREHPVYKNYSDIMAKKTRFAAWLVSSCKSQSKREEFVKKLRKYIPVDVYGQCGSYKCPRDHDDTCFHKFSTQYKFYLSLENSFCEDYVSEKFFRYMELDAIVVARGSGHKKIAPDGTYINAGDYSNVKELANYLLYLDSHPEEYVKILKAKDAYVPMYEDWPVRDERGLVEYMEYHYESVPFCELCLRLWNLHEHRRYVPDINEYFDKGNCVKSADVNVL